MTSNTARVSDVPNQPRTPTRSLRVADPLWSDIVQIAEEQGRTTTDVVRDALENYRTTWVRKKRKQEREQREGS